VILEDGKRGIGDFEIDRNESETVPTKKRKVVGSYGIVAQTSQAISIEKKIYMQPKLVSSVNFNEIQNPKRSKSCPDYTLHIGNPIHFEYVYNRILRPPPSVMLKENSFLSESSSQLFIDVFLIRNNDPNDVVPFLDGKGQKPISNNNYAIFDKLKITHTSVSNKCQFSLKFQLVEFDGSHYKSIPNAYVISNPFDVYSHTSYLSKSKRKSKRKSKIDKPSPPIISMIIPHFGFPGDRCVIIGANFINSKTLIKFGESTIKPEFHEDVTLVFNIPLKPSQSNQYNIQVSNDGEEYCGNNIVFHYST